MLTMASLHPSRRELRIRAARAWWDSSARDGAAVRAVLALLAAEWQDAPTMQALLIALSENVPTSDNETIAP